MSEVIKQNLKTEALKLALECIERGGGIKEGNTVYLHDRELMRIARDAIREALAEQGCDYCNHPQYAGTKCNNCGREQPAQQKMVGKWMGDCIEWIENPYKFHKGQLLYTSPPASKPWVGLTDEEIELIYAECSVWDKFKYERMLEAKLRKKNA